MEGMGEVLEINSQLRILVKRTSLRFQVLILWDLASRIRRVVEICLLV